MTTKTQHSNSSVQVHEGVPALIREIPNRAKQAVGVINAGMLVANYEVPHRDSLRKRGYQRPVSVSRVNKLAADLRGGHVDLPTAVLLNMRDTTELTIEAHPAEERYSIFNPKGSQLFVVDGQHRIEALAKLVNEDPEKWSNYLIPFVCMLGADETEEMTQFYVVNSTAKSVRTDLALDLLKQRAENDPNLMNSLIEKGEDWKVKGQEIAEEMSKLRLWKNRIRFPGEPKVETTIGSAAVVNSLKQLLSTPYFGQISTSNRIRILDAYWEGIERILPDVFKDPLDYALQKSTGVTIMHTLLITVLELLRSSGKSVVEPLSYELALTETLSNLQGDTAEGNVAQGADFWRVGVSGAAGSFTSNAGRRVLFARLRSDLPEVEVE